MKQARGIRNNNPLNIEKSNDVFLGEIRPNFDKRFKKFTSIEYGYRAAFKILKTYITKRGCNTIESIISRWAPPEENDTESYISFVSDYTTIPRDRQISVTDERNMIEIVRAMTKMENGVEAKYNSVKDGYYLANL